MEEYFKFKLKCQPSDFGEFARSYRLLMDIGSGHAGAISYLEFLIRLDVAEADPQTHLQSEWIAKFLEFLLQHHGTERADEASVALAQFWDWCHERRYITGPRPVDFETRSIRPFSIHTKIEQNPADNHIWREPRRPSPQGRPADAKPFPQRGRGR